MIKSALLVGMCGVALVATSCGAAVPASNTNMNAGSMVNENAASSASAVLPTKDIVQNAVEAGNVTTLVVPGRYTAADLMDGQTLTTVQGDTLTDPLSGGSVMINGSAMVQAADVMSSNGVIHLIDSVLMPQ